MRGETERGSTSPRPSGAFQPPAYTAISLLSASQSDISISQQSTGGCCAYHAVYCDAKRKKGMREEKKERETGRRIASGSMVGVRGQFGV